MSENRTALGHPNSQTSWSGHLVEHIPIAQHGSSGRAVESAPRDRVKALSCLAAIEQAIAQSQGELSPVLTEVARLLPAAWQFPDACRARVVLDDQEYRSPAFRASNWRQAADLCVLGQRRGAIEVYYVSRMPDHDEGPFLKEERGLLEVVASRVARLVERHQVDKKLQSTIKELQIERAALQQSNAALHAALERATAEKQASQEAIVTNVDKVLMPLLRALDQELPDDKKRYVSLLTDNLREITSPFADTLSRAFMSLTAVEIRICQMIRDGLTTKEIAKTRKVSPATVARQRERIRHKLALIDTDTNLATYLRTFLVERP
ncbi:MAG TPA: LuxR C-terminal-related transcriptional regulator [Thermoguttaceae bacterium]|nr:LuxR C-terminal-related transcriptional regulator [Thermoguttaceae bacterium]